MFGRIGPMELVLILVVALVIFGPKKLPELGKALGDTFRQFKKHSDKINEELETALEDDSGKKDSPKTALKDDPKIEPAAKASVAGPKA